MPLDAGGPEHDLEHSLEQEQDETVEKERAIVCAACGQLITRRRAQAEVAGRHHHRFMNPSARVFHVRCFEDAPGVAVLGEPTDEYTWFPGFWWRYAHCLGCGAHLGWSFQPGPAEAVAFLGLIAEALVDEDP